MSSVKSAFKALTSEQQALVKERQIAGKHSPDEWLSLLGPVAAFDEQVDAVRKGGGGFWDRRFARKHDVPDGLRTFALPLLPIVREDHDPAVPLELQIDLTGAEQTSKTASTSAPYKKGNYPAVVDTFYVDPWLKGHARFVDGADIHFSVIDHVRASRKTKRSASGKTKQKTKRKRKIEFAVTVSLPARNYAATSAPPAATVEGIRKASVESESDRTVVKLSRTVIPQFADTPPGIEPLLELIGAAYGRVDPTRRKKL